MDKDTMLSLYRLVSAMNDHERAFPTAKMYNLCEEFLFAVRNQTGMSHEEIIFEER